MSESPYMGQVMGVSIGRDEQIKRHHEGAYPYEIRIPNDLYHAYSIDGKIIGKVPDGGRIRFRCCDLFNTDQHFEFRLKDHVEEQEFCIQLSNQIPEYKSLGGHFG